MLYDKKWDEKLPVDNFLSAEELQVSAGEHVALQQVLKMLESGEIQDVDLNTLLCSQNIPKGLFMSSAGCRTACGTAACIGGWVAMLMGVSPDCYVWGYSNASGRSHEPINKLYWGYTEEPTTAKQAAQALRNFLTTGSPNWESVMRS